VAKSTLRLVRPTTEKRTVTPRRRPNAELRTGEHLTEQEVGHVAAFEHSWSLFR
jgi:hypothetical protein